MVASSKGCRTPSPELADALADVADVLADTLADTLDTPQT
jgi:hypothetical protein